MEKINCYNLSFSRNSTNYSLCYIFFFAFMTYFPTLVPPFPTIFLSIKVLIPEEFLLSVFYLLHWFILKGFFVDKERAIDEPQIFILSFTVLVAATIIDLIFLFFFFQKFLLQTKSSWLLILAKHLQPKELQIQSGLLF